MSKYRGIVPSRKAPLTERLAFYSKPSPDSDCILWTGHLNQGGYGRLMFKWRTQTAHRWAWESRHGAIPHGVHVLHRCDVRTCVNPDHLFLGTNDDNVADKCAKGRDVRGKPMGKRLSHAVVREIRALPYLTSADCIKYGRTDGQLRNIRSRRAWKDI